MNAKANKHAMTSTFMRRILLDNYFGHMMYVSRHTAALSMATAFSAQRLATSIDRQHAFASIEM